MRLSLIYWELILGRCALASYLTKVDHKVHVARLCKFLVHGQVVYDHDSKSSIPAHVGRLLDCGLFVFFVIFGQMDGQSLQISGQVAHCVDDRGLLELACGRTLEGNLKS